MLPALGEALETPGPLQRWRPKPGNPSKIPSSHVGTFKGLPTRKMDEEDFFENTCRDLFVELI